MSHESNGRKLSKKVRIASGTGASIGHIGDHFAGGQAAASRSDPDVEFFLFADFKKNRRRRGLAFHKQNLFITHGNQLIPNKTGMFESDMLLDAVVDMQQVFVLIVKIIRFYPHDIAIVRDPYQQHTTIGI